MVGACTPAASATDRVVTPYGPAVASSPAATSTSCARVRSREDLESRCLMLTMITVPCEQLISIDSVANVSLITLRAAAHDHRYRRHRRPQRRHRRAPA